MDVDIITRINAAVELEQTLQQQLSTVQAQKTMLQEVLSVWQTCRDNPDMRAYVQSVIDSFKEVTGQTTSDTTSV